MDIVGYKDFLRMVNQSDIIQTKHNLKGKYADGITVAQQKCLRSLGIGYDGLRYKGQASAVIGIAIDRSCRHLATPGQMRAMEALGVTVIPTRTFKEAQWILDGGDPDEFSLTILLSCDYGNKYDRWVTVAKSRSDARAKFKLLSENDAKNIRFKIIE